MTVEKTKGGMIDAGNELLEPVPSRLTVGQVAIPGDTTRTIATIRTATTTLTLFLSPDEAQQWADLLSGQAKATSPLIVPPAGASIAAMLRTG